MEITFSSSFKRAFRKSVRSKVSLETRFWERMTIFQSDPFDPRLKTHKLSGQLKDLWSFSIEYDVRIIFSFIDDKKALFIDIGTHKEVY
ncbi:MAG: type II toxin-antitoxin system mRNA interferase toxin, RelE/StbE family [Pyrinomonadaceae bacterium]|nr:type II toxin-antitoxin system mRNA interferase toxin, RelE/StbE family [Pyrinomonadaceae bacterium]